MYNMTCDPKTGLPWVNCDGHHNEASLGRSSKDRLFTMADSVASLGLLSWVTGEEKYGRVAARLARAWFLDKKTRMNPNLNYAQVRCCLCACGCALVSVCFLLSPQSRKARW